jgi:hypothetical protein
MHHGFVVCLLSFPTLLESKIRGTGRLAAPRPLNYAFHRARWHGIRWMLHIHQQGSMEVEVSSCYYRLRPVPLVSLRESVEETRYRPHLKASFLAKTISPVVAGPLALVRLGAL